MGIRRINKGLRKNDYKHLENKYNDSNVHNPSHDSNLPTNFELKDISLEDVDQSVWTEFNKRFSIMDRELPLVKGDADISSINMSYFELYDKDKQYISGPIFVFMRTSSQKMFRTNPSYKRVLYSVPKKKAQGIVFEEYISEGPINWELVYSFKYITQLREAANDMEEQLNYYFRNKRNIIVCNGERFSIGPASGAQITEVDLANFDDAGSRSLYVIDFALKVWCWTIDSKTVQKRERPNKFTFDIVVKDGEGNEISSDKDTINIERYNVNLNNYPKKPKS